MRAPILSRLAISAAAAAMIACGDSPAPTAPDPRLGARAERTALPDTETPRIAVIGLLEEVRGSTLLVRQEGPTVPEGTPPGRVELPLGDVGDRIAVRTDASTELFVAGDRVTIELLAPGMRLIASGEGAGESLLATRISDLGVIAAPTEAIRAALKDRIDTTSGVVLSRAMVPPMAAAAICASQDFAYGTDVDEFQGCWGGPSMTGSYNNPDVPVGCPLLGCFMLTRVSYTLALGGWSFAFPFRFSAAGDLVYHVPGTVTLGLEALPATTGDFTFAGGLGVDFGFTFEFCWITGGCDDLGTYHISPFSTAHQATEKLPFSGQVTPIAEVGCPSIPIVPFFPGLDFLGLGLCEDLSFKGAPFQASVRSPGAWPPANDVIAFDGAAEQLAIRPNASVVRIQFDEFEYIPTLAMGFYFRLKSLGITLFETPSIPISDGPFEAITTPFPREGSAFSENIPQPTLRTIDLDVAPAPTTLTIVSPSALAEGTPVRIRLAEAYDGSPITGAIVTFTATGEGQALTRAGTTGTDGIVAFLLPNGQYTVRALFSGSPTYRPAQSAERQVDVYQPTTFVIWGGNPGGVPVGSRHLFWGSQWWKSIIGGDYRGNASFKGFATPSSETEWVGDPGSSGAPPATVGRLIGVIVSTRVLGRGSRAEGNIADWVILRVEDPGAYAPSAGHPAYGVLLRRIAATPE